MLRSLSPTRLPWPLFLLLTLALCLLLQAAIILAHEYTHSTTAWLLGDLPSPASVIWGNPITMRGWDEGVPYDQLFRSRGILAEALIGGMPLLLHTVFVTLSLSLLQRPAVARRTWLFFTLYWFTVINLAELVAYILMRPFAGSGDTGRFNEGLALSPWFLFVTGTLLLLVAFTVLLRSVTPTLFRLLGDNPALHRTAVWLTAFILFLSASGLRILSLYPDRQWHFGLVGLVGFIAWLVLNRRPAALSPA